MRQRRGSGGAHQEKHDTQARSSSTQGTRKRIAHAMKNSFISEAGGTASGSKDKRSTVGERLRRNGTFPKFTTGASTLALGRQREREDDECCVPMKSTVDWISKRLLAWLRKIGLEFVEIIVKSDNEPVLTSSGRLMDSNVRAMKVGSTDDCREWSSGQLEEQRNSVQERFNQFRA